MNPPAPDFRVKLEQSLDFFKQEHPAQASVADKMLLFLRSTPDCFERSHKEGHFTGSAWLVNPAGDKALLTLHRKLKRWMQTGGHADGDPNLLAVALREATEESGIGGICPVSEKIFDIDIHEIPARPATGEAAHLHYDVRYLLRAPHEDFCISDESDALAWWNSHELEAHRTELDEAVIRMQHRYFEG